ncbi:serine racemase isoform X2 [Phragmites australis]|uniref:serine racemase isoform X2 n=1 Tax=Phragmites australis TaxID=29695 RepID=UPI002D770957|nr:serine racemase isoform X2 [Phragmites australis]
MGLRMPSGPGLFPLKRSSLLPFFSCSRRRRPPLFLARSGDWRSIRTQSLPSFAGLMGSRDGGGRCIEGGQGYAADIDSIREAQARIAPYVHKTPVLSSTSIDAIVGKQLFFKCECFQKAGAFKIRGASNSIFALDDKQASKGVVTHSSGQGTVSLELLEQVPEIDTIIVPISGGGLISGVALAAKAINPSIRILAAEPKGADDSAQSKAAGKIITLPSTNTIADGLRAFLGDLTWPVVRDLVDDIIVVDDDAIVDAMKMCYEILKMAVEPSGAIGLAAALSDEFKQSCAWHESSKIGIIVSGGNVDLGVLWESLYKR